METKAINIFFIAIVILMIAGVVYSSKQNQKHDKQKKNILINPIWTK